MSFITSYLFNGECANGHVDKGYSLVLDVFCVPLQIYLHLIPWPGGRLMQTESTVLSWFLTSPQREPGKVWVGRSAAGVLPPQLHPCACMSWQPIALKGSSSVLEVRGQKSVLLGRNPGFCRAVFLLETREESVSLPFSSFLKVPTFSWLMATHHSDLCFLCHISFSALDSPSWSVLCKNPVITMGPLG